MTDLKVVPLKSWRDRARPVLLRDVIGSVLRRERRRQGRTLEDVATRAGVSIQYLSEIERGVKEPSSEVLAAVCGSLGGQLVDLVGAVHVELSGSGGIDGRRYRPTSNLAVPAQSAQPELLAA